MPGRTGRTAGSEPRSDGNPYSDPPANFPDNPAIDYMGSAWLGTTTVYGPAFTAASEPLAIVAGDSDAVAAWSYKALAAAAALAAALLAGRLARRRAFAIALVGWNPVLAIHPAGGGHNDAWVGALILAALALSASRRAQAGGALWVLAIAVKWVPALFLALRSLESRATGRPHGARGLAGAAAGIAVGATVLYGGAWPLAIFPLVGNAALETSYAFPHRLEQLGLPDDLALAVAIAALVVGLASSPAAPPRARATGACRLPRARDDPLPCRLVPGVGRSGCRRRGGRRRDGRRPRSLRLPAAPDDPDLRPAAIPRRPCGGRSRRPRL